mmetsp:Transcript_29853/g.81947  ORF Transcript_29853/g.81947 Transcript_29853/m.81947 type:complete len:193 (-) Transcript_29853:105-683(-)
MVVGGRQATPRGDRRGDGLRCIRAPALTLLATLIIGEAKDSSPQARQSPSPARRGFSVKPDGSLLEHLPDGSVVDFMPQGAGNSAGDVLTIRSEGGQAGGSATHDLLPARTRRSDEDAAYTMIWKTVLLGGLLGGAKFLARLRDTRHGDESGETDAGPVATSSLRGADGAPATPVSISDMAGTNARAAVGGS